MEKYALVLSGGGARGAYEIGVWQALREMEIPVHIVTGASVGALNGCLVAQNKFDEAVELWERIETHHVFDVDENGSGFKLNTGTSGLAEIIREYADEEAIRESDIEFGLVMVQLPDMKPHYLYVDQIENGKLHDSILASAAFFPALEAVEIDGKKYIDGGYADVMPVKMAVERGADHVIAVYLDGLGILRRNRLRKAVKQTKSFRMIRSHWDLGDVLSFDINNTKRIMRLGYLDAMKSFEQIDGFKYSFEKDTFTLHDLLGADAAADAFDLDPSVIYDKAALLEKLQIGVANSPIADNGVFILEDIKTHFSTGALVGFIAADLHKKEADSIFLTKPAFNLLRNEIQAANFMIKMGIL